MTDDSVFNKEKLVHLSKKTTTVEAAFDSDESDWSDDDGENNTFAAMKETTTPDTNTLKSFKNISAVETPNNNPPRANSFDKAEHSPYFNADPVVPKNTSFPSPPKKRDSIGQSEPQQQLSTSPYFVKESNYSQKKVSIEEKVDGKGTVAAFAKQEKIRDDHVQDDDDWDEESCIVNNMASENAFFQPTSSNLTKQHAKGHGSRTGDPRKSTMVDWSETFSDGGSEVENVEIDNIDNLPVDDGQAEEETIKQEKSNYNNNEGANNKEMLDIDVGGIVFNNNNDTNSDNKESTPNSPNNISKADTLDTLIGHKGVVATSSADSTSSRRKSAELGAESSADYLNSRDDTTVFGNESPIKNNIPSSSSATQLFMASSSTTPASLDSSKSTLNLTASNPYLVDAGKAKKKTNKPTSARNMFTRLFSTESSKNLKSETEPTELLPARKTSEPIPLSTLLLNTPIPASSSESERSIIIGNSQRSHHHAASSVPPLIPTKYFPPVRTLEPGNTPQVGGGGGESDLLATAPGLKKKKGFIGKMKKTLGFSSKGSKMRASESSKSLAVIPTASTTTGSDTNIYGENSREGMISVQTKGRPANEVIAELLQEGKRYLENPNYSPGPGRGDGDTLLTSKRYGQSQSSMDITDQLKRYSSEDILTVGSSKGVKSEISLADDQQASVVTQGPRMSRDGKLYYCSQAVENAPNRQVMYNLIQDFCCVLDKSFGEQDRLASDNGNLFTEIDNMRAALECCEADKREMERKFQELQGDFQKLQFCLEEECQARVNLEGIICELKAQLDRQDEILNNELAEKANILSSLKQFETDNWGLKNQISDFGAERDEFVQSFKGLECTKNKCMELQRALAECCEKHDAMQKEILDLRNENNEIKLKLDNCIFEKNQEINNILKNEVYGLKTENNKMKLKLDNCEFEKNKLINEIEAMKQEFSAEKATLEAKICELLEGITNLEKTKGEICKQTNTMLAAHHEEMDNLKAEADNYKAKYEEEHKMREEIEKRCMTMSNTATSPPQSLPITSRSSNCSPYSQFNARGGGSGPSSLSPTSMYNTNGLARTSLRK